MTPTNSCLDGETLAAWVDGGLSRNEAAMAEAHVSSCPRCQEIAGLIVKTTPAAIADAPWWRKRAAWLVPVTAGITAAGLLLIAPKNPSSTPVPPPAAATLESARTLDPPSVPPTIAPVAPPAEKTIAQAKPAETRPADAQKERQRDERATSAPGAAGAAGGVAGALPSAPSIQSTPSPATRSPAATPPAVSSERIAADQGARQSFAIAAAKQAVSPDGALHWRITDRGAVERSTDGGTTWHAVNVGVTATFTSVQAPEPRTALVTTTDGRVFRTSDGGATWTMQGI